MAAICGSEEVLRFLISKAVSDTLPDILDAKDNYSETALMVAVRMGNVVAAKILVESGAKVNTQDDAGRTVLHFAASNCPQLITSLMTANNGIAFMADHDGCTPLHIATKSCSDQLLVVYYLLQNHVPLNKTLKDGHIVLSNVLSKGSIEVVRVLLEHGADVQAADSKGRKPLHHAAEHGIEIGILHILLDAGSDIGALSITGETPLFRAVISNKADNLRLLIKRGGMVNECRKDGWMPLHIAAYCGHIESAVALLEGGASINQLAVCQATPLYLAQQENMVEMAKLLLKRGADPNLAADRGTSPVYIDRKGKPSRYLLGVK
ncbi:uncharacterized protein TRIVIDRAFT_162632 [Trichoderma virens Gv29-8]|uniref:Uncharacterized protein n=1 Tax=Hypocrea virens (strain Gv29-8 / FGSC 10586) TaxID=413071 RepID=G9N9Y0_HYPVG|nr:uncharacterized protein TRIVIDRAFT_162632 [Trichoderma virens Gv29-8]EHK16748.1 hypothetical protein TRIVIDRAFT_162632 [Trichoderma virens Gv29-8]